LLQTFYNARAAQAPRAFSRRVTASLRSASDAAGPHGLIGRPKQPGRTRLAAVRRRCSSSSSGWARSEPRSDGRSSFVHATRWSWTGAGDYSYLAHSGNSKIGSIGW